MQVLLLSMPDSFEHMAPVAVRMPNGALTSLAGQRRSAPPRRRRRPDPRAGSRPCQTVERLARSASPDVVGLSVMTFQRRTALRVSSAASSACVPQARRSSSAGTIRAWRPSLRGSAAPGSTSIVRGRRRASRFASCCARSRSGATLGHIPGLSWRHGPDVRHNPDRPVSSLTNGELRPAEPRRARARRLHAARPPGGRHRDVARLHVTTAASARSSRCAAGTSTRSTSRACSPTSPTRGARRADALSRRRQHHARRPRASRRCARRSSTPG